MLRKKTVRLRSNRCNGGMARPDVDSCDDSSDPKGRNMGGIGKERKPPKPVDDKSKEKSKEKSEEKSKKPPPPQAEDDEPEDGDIATPKRDRHGNDDEPL
jgi:hypothetical protein